VVQIALTNDPNVKATGRVWETAPQADANTRTFHVKVGIIDPPEAMRLAPRSLAASNWPPPAGLEIPATALTEANERPAVWVVDPQSQTVSLRNVDVLRYNPAEVVISHGLETGEVVVTAGVQVLRPGQQVRLLGAA
jgi:multidrug efflux pump subunit AcrA (membrane-fusion protein)